MSLPLDLASLRAAVAEGQRFTYRFFWGHRPRNDGSLSDGCFSQWWRCRFELQGQLYTSAEQWMMASKARLFDDQSVLEQIMHTDEPDAVKRLGRKVSGFDETAWMAAAFDLVTLGNVAKFGQDPRLEAYLVATGNDLLVEASPHDAIWGIGLGRKAPEAKDPRRWRGLNLLGFAICRARGVLRGESDPPIMRAP